MKKGYISLEFHSENKSSDVGCAVIFKTKSSILDEKSLFTPKSIPIKNVEEKNNEEQLKIFVFL